MSKNSENQLTSDIRHKQSCVRTILFAWTALVMLVAMADPTFADDTTATELPSPLWLADIESLDMGTSLTLSENAYEILTELHAVRLTDFPLSRNETVELELEQFSITTPTTLIVAGTEQGDIPIAPPEISLFRGSISGVNDSRVVLGISRRGCHGFLWNGQKGHVITPIQWTRKAGVDLPHVIHKFSDLPELKSGKAPWCGGTLAPPEGPASLDQASPGASAAQFRSLRVALECDYEYWSSCNDLADALEYIYILFGAGNDIFQRDVSVKITLNFIRIWTTINDPYSYVGGASDALVEFENYWRANHNPGKPAFIERDLAHMLSSRPINGWGEQGNALCNYDRGYSCSGGNHLLPTVAENLVHDAGIVFHELGHNSNAQHTHDFSPPIDCCVAQGQCTAQDCNDTPSTIMSYCHNCPGGRNNILHQFHTRNIARMRTEIDASCLWISRHPCYVDWRNTSGTEDGTSAHPYNTVKEGAEAVLPNGTVSIANGSYAEYITIWQPMTLTATGGTVNIGE
jgi:hypothetical protein